jgi:hypothetical protein
MEAQSSGWAAPKHRAMALDDRIRRFLADPPPGSKTRAALEHGVDLTLTTRRLAMSVDERFADLGARMAWVKTLRRARFHRR